MSRIYYRSSFFLYSVSPGKSPILQYYRLTVYTFWKPVKKDRMRAVLEDWIGESGDESPTREPASGFTSCPPVPWCAPKYQAYEAEQVQSGESSGLGFNWYAVSHTKSRDEPEVVREVFFKPIYESINVRLGYARVLGGAKIYGGFKKFWAVTGRPIIEFGRWLTRGR